VPFGKDEALAVYLNGTDLPQEVYAECSLDGLGALFKHVLGGHGAVGGDWTGERESALYLYGPSAEAMHGAIREVLEKYPLCRGARVVRFA
jgi:hypothetical protein